MTSNFVTVYIFWLFFINVRVNEHIRVKPRLHAIDVYFFHAGVFFCSLGHTAQSAAHAPRRLSCLVKSQCFSVSVKLRTKPTWISALTWAPPQWRMSGNIFRPVICQTADRYREKSEPECVVSPRPAVWAKCSFGPGFYFGIFHLGEKSLSWNKRSTG